MELIEIVPLLFIGEIAVILALYRWLLRGWIVDHWEAKIETDGWLVEKLEPVIEEIETRTHESLVEFKTAFVGSLGPMVRDAKKLDPMNNLRSAAKNGDWTSMLLEYVANKSGLSQNIAGITQIIPETSPKDVEKPSEYGKFK